MTADERALREGGLAIVPTDTVYGIGCAAFLPEACARLYASKSRPAGQPTALVAGLGRQPARARPARAHGRVPGRSAGGCCPGR